MIIETLVVGMIQANCYIVADPATNKAIVIDPGGDAPVIVERVKSLDLDVVAILATHGHFDHVEGLGELKESLDAPIYIHEADLPLLKGMKDQGAIFGLNVKEAPKPDHFLTDGQEIDFGTLTAKVIHTPGHSLGSVTFHVGNKLFVGDLLFKGSIGRTDLMGGNYEQLLGSVRERIFTLADDTVVYSGHGPKTNVAVERHTNPFFR